MPFYPLNKLENENFERMKKTPGDIIILQLCTINDNIEWDMEWYILRYGVRWTEFVVVLGHFLHFYPSNPENKNFEKNEEKKKIIKFILNFFSSFYTSVSQIMIICYIVPEIWHVTNVIIFHFGLFFALLHPSRPKNQYF